MRVRTRWYQEGGLHLAIVADVDCDGVIMTWSAIDPATGVAVDLEPLAKWSALSALHRAIEARRMAS